MLYYIQIKGIYEREVSTMYYLVTCERGHCGNRKSSYIKFAFEAANMIEAVDMARKMPSVKHSRYCVQAKVISYEEYTDYIQINAYERYEQWRPEPKRIWYGKRRH